MRSSLLGGAMALLIAGAAFGLYGRVVPSLIISLLGVSLLGVSLLVVAVLSYVLARNTSAPAAQPAQSQAAEPEAANRELAGFIYAVSHDLRAPLRIIDGFSEALEEDCSDRLDEQGRDYLRRIRGAAASMERQIDGLLELSRVSQAPIRRERIDVSALARSIGQRLAAAEPARIVELRIEPDLVVQADPKLFEMALEHLLANSWKFTRERNSASITLGREETDGRRLLYIRDNGAGFDPLHASRMFDAFQRLHTASEFEGTGIGLAVVQRVVHRHGGRVSAGGEAGSGTTVYIDLG